MFLIDDIAKAPLKGFMFIVKEVANAAQQELKQQRADLMAELSGLHLKLESNEISEAEFDEREQQLLDLLEAIDADS